MIALSQYQRQTINRLKHLRICPVCRKQNLSSLWLTISVFGYNGGNITGIAKRLRVFKYVRSLYRNARIKAERHCFICGVNTAYNI